MRYGEEIQIVGGGFVIAPKLLEPIGIFHNSTCWGIWRSTRLERIAGRTKWPHRFPHLVLSPIHPDLWPFTSRIEVILDREAGSLAALTAELQELRLNIQIGDAAIEGYEQASFNAIIEHELVRQELAATLPLLSGESETPISPSDRVRRFQRVGEEMVKDIFRVWFAIRDHEASAFDEQSNAALQQWKPVARQQSQGDRRPFLSSRPVELGSRPWFLRHDDIERLLIGNQLGSTLLQVGAGVDPSSLDRIMTRMIPERFFDRNASGSDAFHLAPASGALPRDALLGENMDPEVLRPCSARLTEESAWIRWHLREKAKSHVPATEAFVGDYLKRFWRRHWSHPVNLRALTRLAYMRMWASEDAGPIAFRYDAKRGFMEPSDRAAILRFTSGFLSKRAELPDWAMASFHRVENFVRIEPLPAEETSQHWVRIDVSYTAQDTYREGPAAEVVSPPPVAPSTPVPSVEVAGVCNWVCARRSGVKAV